MPPVGTADYPAETEQNNLPATADPLAEGTKGFTAAIYPTGDVDVFSVDVTVAGSVLKVSTGDGMGGCPAGAATLVRVFGPSGFLGSDTDSGPASCSQIMPATNPAMGNLAVGKYSVQVESATFSPLPFYVVDIAVTAPGCGDGLVQGNEQCDDGNNTSGDGCAADCKLEGNYPTEMEPNQPINMANSISGTDGVVAAIQPIGDQDFFTFQVAVSGTRARIEVTDGQGNCPSGFDSKMYLYNAAGTEIAVDDDDGLSTCSLLDPTLDAVVANLAAGKYTVMVEEYSNDEAQASYVLQLQLTEPGCGDTFVQVGEQCDDGNTTAGDGCSPTCQLEGNYLTETEPNQPNNQANSVVGYDGVVGSILPAGDQDYFSFQVTEPGSSVTIEVTDGYGGCPSGFDSKIYLYSPSNQLLVSDDEDGVESCSLINPLLDPSAATNLPVGTYVVMVEEYLNDDAQSSYVLKVKVAAPGCGDSILTSPGEQCDDGNTVAGDGCSPTCMAETPWEIEPNASTATASPVWPMTTSWYGKIDPIADVDYFVFDLPEGQSPVITSHAIGNAATCDFDTVIHLLDANGVQIVEDDDDGPGNCSMLSKANDTTLASLPAGTYYVWIQEYNNDSKITGYELSLTFE
ncbi:DUF4215 domain-containing protein [Polyangium fumosum]|uniref:DUF4215 domain-containing protein n=2 Tax=Polyangium fumosum TaxID=889272 RepID=A0A4U1IZY2_9BACT|nr:DUF4215 domain-containing protein [Polyangium fumosum]